MSEAPLELHPLRFVAERDGVIVGRADTSSYALLPPDGAELLRRLADGTSVADAAAWYFSTFHETVDMADFIAALRDLGFVRTAGEKPADQRQVRYQALGRALFSPAAWVVYASVTAAALAAMAWQPALRPRPGDVFFVRSLVVMQAVLMLAQFPATLLHEWFHVMAARRRGVPSRLGVNRRLYFFVFETRLDGLLGLPRRQRYLPFFAGMLADVLVASGLTLAALAGLHGASYGAMSWPARLALAIAYTTLLRVAWQLFVFLRTDPYFALTTVLGCTNLAEASSAYLRERIGRRTRRAADEQAAWSPRDQQFAPWFALLTVAGTATLLAFAAIAVIPIAITFAHRLTSGITRGVAGGTRFWDSTASFVFLALEFLILPFLAGWMARRNEARMKGIAQ